MQIMSFNTVEYSGCLVGVAVDLNQRPTTRVCVCVKQSDVEKCERFYARHVPTRCCVATSPSHSIVETW